MSEVRDSNSGKTLALIGAPLFVFGPFLGLLGTVIGVMHAFQTMSGNGVTNVNQLALSVGAMLVMSIVGLVLGLIGLVCFLVSILGCGYRAKWVFWVLIVVGVLHLPAHPVGTIIGLAILAFCFSYKDEFLGQKSGTQPIDF